MAASPHSPDHEDQPEAGSELPSNEAARPTERATRTEALGRYFSSGWAFLLPYVGAYQLYARLEWPANPQTGTSRAAIHFPSLVETFWVLHCLHLVLGIFTLVSRSGRASSTLRSSSWSAEKTEAIRPGFPWSAAIPWILLALIFLIPGIYLEWPADPWEHLRRINEWSVHPTLEGYSAGYKSFYFFAYSLCGWIPEPHRLPALTLYYVGVCMLLAWQYFRLARTIGLDRQWAFLSVLLNVFCFGNVCFSFYRYYGLASSMYAQIGAVALVRLVAKWAQFSAAARNLGFTAAGWSERARTSAKVELALALAALLAFVATNHVQGLGIVMLGVVSVGAWWLSQKGRRAIAWMVAGIIVVNVAAYFCLPRNPAFASLYRPQGWLSAWDGFDLLTWLSPALDRSLQILGLLGLLNLIAAIELVRRRHLAGWITIGPILLLLMPVVAIPLATVLGMRDPADILIFNRLLFAIPSGLALVTVAQVLAIRYAPSSDHGMMQWGLGTFAGLVLVVLSPGRSAHNRTWHLLAITPPDLTLAGIRNTPLDAVGSRSAASTDIVATPPIEVVMNALHPEALAPGTRMIGAAMNDTMERAITQTLAAGNEIEAPYSTLTSDPEAADPKAWTTFSGPEPKFVSYDEANRLRHTLQSERGRYSAVFSSNLIPLVSHVSYQVRATVRQPDGGPAVTYLAIAWYDAQHRLLEANQPVPAGAGSPRGWVNGYFSYFGLTGEPTPRDWTTYWHSFGGNESATIPAAARYARLGALMNFTAQPNVVVQVTDLRMREKSVGDRVADGNRRNDARVEILVPSAAAVTTVASQAAQASLHWPAQQVASDLAGGPEIEAAARASAARRVRLGPAGLEIYEIAPRQGPAGHSADP